MASDHRHAQRCQLVAEAEATESSSEIKLSCKTTDLSLGGCFLDMLNPFAEGTDVRVRISHNNTTFTALGKVAFVLPNLGMGVEFRSVGEVQLAILHEWISELSRAK